MVGAAVLLGFDERLLPPPEGLASDPLSLSLPEASAVPEIAASRCR